MARGSDAELAALAHRIQRRMDALGWNQREAAERLDWNRVSLSTLLSGTRATSWPEGNVLARMPRVFRCSYQWLFTGEGHPDDPAATTAQHFLDGYGQAVADMERLLEELRGQLKRPRLPGRPRG